MDKISFLLDTLNLQIELEKTKDELFLLKRKVFKEKIEAINQRFAKQ